MNSPKIDAFVASAMNRGAQVISVSVNGSGEPQNNDSTFTVPRIDLDMIDLKPEVRERVQQIIFAFMEYSNSLRYRDVVRFKLAETFTSTHGDTVYYVCANEKEGKETFKNVVQAFCKEHGFGTISMGFSELIYSDTDVKGMIEFSNYTDKTFGFSYLMDVDFVDSFTTAVKNRENANDTPLITRLSMNNRGDMVENTILFNKPKIDMPAEIMYPFLDTTPEELAEQFMASSANVLLLYGQPGTGKTTFIKRMLQGVGFDENRTVSVIDTPGVLSSPELINNIYAAKHKDIFIFEDVDRHLYSREDGNEIMAGLLNAAEGLASPDVKIILSTNIQNLNDCDSALLRPGRCFKTVEFHKLELPQQIHVREFLGLDVAVCTEAVQSLAEVMNDPATDNAMTGNGFV